MSFQIAILIKEGPNLAFQGLPEKKIDFYQGKRRKCYNDQVL
jgi:hypothetical protein